MQLPPLSRSPFRRQPADMLERFNGWLETEAGQAVLEAERATVAEWTPRLVGQRAVEVSGGRCQDMLRDIRLPWRCSKRCAAQWRIARRIRSNLLSA